MRIKGSILLTILVCSLVGLGSTSVAEAKSRVKEPTEKQAFTVSERKTIKNYRQQLKKISNSTKGMYTQKPSLKKTFKPGKLSSKYVNAAIQSVNFYRKMYGLNNIVANEQWNADAQYGAATMAAAGQGLSHGLVGMKRPSYVPKAAWKRGTSATDYSNIGQGLVRPYDNVMNYLVDRGQSDYIPGHREWLLGNTIEIGIGQAGEYSDFKVFEGFAKCRAYGDAAKEVAYPKAGVFPKNALGGSVWSFSYTGDEIKNQTKPTVKVMDNTTHKRVKVSHVTNYNNVTGYGWFKTSISYQPKASQIKVNHAYTVKISRMSNHKNVNYQTKLYMLTK